MSREIEGLPCPPHPCFYPGSPLPTPPLLSALTWVRIEKISCKKLERNSVSVRWNRQGQTQKNPPYHKEQNKTKRGEKKKKKSQGRAQELLKHSACAPPAGHDESLHANCLLVYLFVFKEFCIPHIFFFLLLPQSRSQGLEYSNSPYLLQLSAPLVMMEGPPPPKLLSPVT